jgi:hypothetical protein
MSWRCKARAQAASTAAEWLPDRGLVSATLSAVMGCVSGGGVSLCSECCMYVLQV